MKRLVILLFVIFSINNFLFCKTAGVVDKLYPGAKLINVDSGKPLVAKDKLSFDQKLENKGTGVVKLLLNVKDTIIMMQPKTQIIIREKTKYKKKSGIFLAFGRLLSIFSKKVKSTGYAVETFNSVSGVEGTCFEVLAEENVKSELIVYEGIVKFKVVDKKKSIFPPIGIKKILTVKQYETAFVDAKRKLKGVFKFTEEEREKYLSIWPEDVLMDNEIVSDESLVNDTEYVYEDDNKSDDLESPGTQKVAIILDCKDKGGNPFGNGIEMKIQGKKSVNGVPIALRGDRFIISDLENYKSYDVTYYCNSMVFYDKIEIGEETPGFFIYKQPFRFTKMKFGDGSKITNKEKNDCLNIKATAVFDFKIMFEGKQIKMKKIMDGYNGIDYAILDEKGRLKLAYPEKYHPLQISVDAKGFETAHFEVKYSETRKTVGLRLYPIGMKEPDSVTPLFKIEKNDIDK